MADELILDVTTGGAFVSKATDPVVTNVATPGDFAAQFPTPLDTTELVTMCEELNVWRSIPEVRTGLKTYTWRQMDTLAMTSGSAYVGFSDGACPEEYAHDGDNLSVDLKNLGVKKSLTISDIMHSVASIQAGYGINRLAPGWAAGEGMPGGDPNTAGYLSTIADLKAKEMQLGATLLMNEWDKILVAGNDTTNPLLFDGIETQVTAVNGAHANAAGLQSGTFSVDTFDGFLAEGCAKPTHIFGHPQVVQAMLSAYFQLGFQGSHVISTTNQEKVVPGFNFAGEVYTGVGRLIVIADANFTRTQVGSTGVVDSKLYPLRMTHNGENLVYKITQIPLAFKDLAPGCTAISFQMWTKTALVIKAMCAQSVYGARFAQNIVTTCSRI